MDRYLKKLNQVATEWADKRHFFNPLDALLFTIAPYTKVGNQRKHEAIIRRLSPDFKAIMDRNLIGGGKNKLQEIGRDSPVWVLWAQGREAMPPIVAACVRSIERNAGTHPVNVLDSENIREFVDLPRVITDKLDRGLISYTHFSDIVRMALLGTYGGYWIDATIYLSGPLPDYALPFYSIRQHRGNGRFVECKDGSNWSAYFIACGPGNVYARTVYDFFLWYWEHHDRMVDYFLIDYAIAMLYRYDRGFHGLVESVPFDNEGVNDMRLSLNRPFTDALWSSLGRTRYNKLSWKMALDDGDTVGRRIVTEDTDG